VNKIHILGSLKTDFFIQGVNIIKRLRNSCLLLDHIPWIQLLPFKCVQLRIEDIIIQELQED